MNRKEFLQVSALAPFLGYSTMNLHELDILTHVAPATEELPVLFIGHGNPMNALYNNAFTQKLGTVGSALKAYKPKAVLVISAHWLTKGTHVCVAEKPQTIYDFGGFPRELYQVQYPAPGSPEFARLTKKALTQVSVQESNDWGLDHGAWTVLKHMFPEASLPVFQLSIDYTKPPEFHYNLAKQLRALRSRGVLIISSGNIVHNLREIDFSDNAKPFAWAVEFDDIVKGKLEDRDDDALINYSKLGSAALRSVPTNDHYLPMLYTLGASSRKEKLQFVYEDIEAGSISMRCFQIQ